MKVSLKALSWTHIYNSAKCDNFKLKIMTVSSKLVSMIKSFTPENN